MQPNQTDLANLAAPASPASAVDNVWISREEYDRLRAASAQQPAVPYIMASVHSSSSSQALDPSVQSKIKRSQTIVGVVLAIGLFLSLTTSSSRVLTGPLVIIFLIFAAVSVRDNLRSKKLAEQSATGLLPDLQQAAFNPYKFLLKVVLVIILTPVLVFIGFIVLILGATGGQGS